MSRTAAILCVASLMLGGAAAVAHAECPEDGSEIAIEITPSAINLKSPGRWVTVHAEIPFTCVEEQTVTLQEVDESDILSDWNGELVAKFPMWKIQDELKDVETPKEVELWLFGEMKDGGGLFSGVAEVWVLHETVD